MNSMFQCPADPTPNSYELLPIDNGIHLGMICKSRKRNRSLVMNLSILPEGHDHEHRITYRISEDWRPGSEFTTTLTNLGVLMSPGSYFDPRSLVGLPIMLDVQAVEDELGYRVYTVLEMRSATEQEATRTDFDEEDLSTDFDDVFSDFAHNDDLEEEIDMDREEDSLVLDLDDDFIWED
ncbi:hypothetical protein MHH52_28560 [Paenibacillus sp. FSL K6-0276]|uniref:hypothetical protein n=1 Tax=Paenibacillus sp. FSL K6-0276 TaxID=2921450 RepID=UPI0030EC324B